MRAMHKLALGGTTRGAALNACFSIYLSDLFGLLGKPGYRI
jgi:hypothetical protein